jgi:folate-binding protein YgfZ
VTASDGGYGAARDRAALVILEECCILEATGPHRQKFLQGMLSNDVAGLRPGQGCRAALLDVKGHVLALMRVLVTHDAVILEMPRDRRTLVEGVLNHHKVAAPVRFKIRPTAVLGLLGPAGRDVLQRAGANLPVLGLEEHAAAEVASNTALVVAAGDFPAGGFVLHVPDEARTAIHEALANAGAEPLDRDSLDALRVEEGRAWFGPDVTEENLLHEVGRVADHVSFSKGCYVGQEVVARLDARGGNVNKALRGLRLEAASKAGTVLRAGDKEVGRITTAAVSPRLGPIAMGYVHRSHFEPGTVVDASGIRATVASLPLALGPAEG